jgi:hypothetical protein
MVPSSPPNAAELERVANEWKAEDRQAFANRQQILERMRQLRSINESLAEWTQNCKREWDQANRDDEARHNARLQWNESNTSLPVSCVPSLKSFNEKPSAGFDSINDAPHWFDTVCISAEASKLAFDSVKAGECNVNVSTTGGKAVSGLFDMLVDAKKLWTQPVSSVNNTPVSFNWSSHDYDASKEKEAVASKLSIGAPTSSLPREYENDIEFYMRSVASAEPSKVAADGVSACADGLKRMSMPSTLKKPSTSVATAAAGWWKSDNWYM